MKEQLLKLLSHLNVSATQFAEEIGVQRSSISHILSGRNKPSYDFIIKLLEKYPSINPIWLLAGKGEMLLDSDETSTADRRLPLKVPMRLERTENNGDKSTMKKKREYENVGDKSKLIGEVTNVNNIELIIILYTNGTFEHYRKK
ncbi:MAG: helix-turn-helix transcriptional regulator [Bacteroidales bacterium]|nr:helix-turn-helix transcriptional regulator [Bacteroidales bacterium]